MDNMDRDDMGGMGIGWGVADVDRVVSIDGVCEVRHIF